LLIIVVLTEIYVIKQLRITQWDDVTQICITIVKINIKAKAGNMIY